MLDLRQAKRDGYKEKGLDRELEVYGHEQFTAMSFFGWTHRTPAIGHRSRVDVVLAQAMLLRGENTRASELSDFFLWKKTGECADKSKVKPELMSL